VVFSVLHPTRNRAAKRIKMYFDIGIKFGWKSDYKSTTKDSENLGIEASIECKTKPAGIPVRKKFVLKVCDTGLSLNPTIIFRTNPYL
jgi:hypothetical protein